MSTSYDRTAIVRGAGTVKLGNVQFFDKGGISAAVETERTDDKVNGYGTIDKTKADEIIKVSFTPAGEITPEILAALYPYGATLPDASLCGAADTPCIVHSMAGVKLTLPNAFLSQMPALKLGAQETPFDAAEIIGLVKNDTARTAADALFAVATEAWSGTYDASKKIKASYSGEWGGISIIAAEGWNITFDLSIKPFKTADLGTIDYTLENLTVKASCRPLNLSEAMWNSMRIQGAGAAIGSSSRQGKDLAITADIAGGIDITLKNAIFAEGPLAWGEGELRAGEIGFEATRDLTAGETGVFEIGVHS